MMTFRDGNNTIGGRSQNGYTFAELLVTMAMMVLVTTIMATGVPVAIRAYVGVMDSANAQLLLSTATIRLRDELSVADPKLIADPSSIDLGADKVVYCSFIRIDNGIRTTIYKDLANTENGIMVRYDLAVGDGGQSPEIHHLVPPNTRVGAWTALLGDSKLKVECDLPISYDANNGSFTIENLRVLRTNAEEEGDSEESGNSAMPKFDTLPVRVLASPVLPVAP